MKRNLLRNLLLIVLFILAVVLGKLIGIAVQGVPFLEWISVGADRFICGDDYVWDFGEYQCGAGDIIIGGDIDL